MIQMSRHFSFANALSNHTGQVERASKRVQGVLHPTTDRPLHHSDDPARQSNSAPKEMAVCSPPIFLLSWPALALRKRLLPETNAIETAVSAIPVALLRACPAACSALPRVLGLSRPARANASNAGSARNPRGQRSAVRGQQSEVRLTVPGRSGDPSSAGFTETQRRRTRSNFGMAVISLLFSSTFTWPSVNPLVDAHALTT